MTLFPNLVAKSPAAPSGIDLRCCDVAEVLREVRGARLIHADPPWRYAREAGVANPETNGIYAGLSEGEIVTHLDASYDCAAPAGCRLLTWYTWPKDAEWTTAGGAGKRWGSRTTGGAWSKFHMEGDKMCGSVGVGFHWRGKTEPVAMFTRGACGRPRATLPNGHVSPPGQHSEKPVEWLRE